MSETEERARVVAIAKSWLCTEYHDNAAIKGVGVDCGTLLAECFIEAGLIPRFEIEPYSPQWHLHHAGEKYLSLVEQFATEFEGPPKPADIVMFRFGKGFSHGAIVVAWPLIIHARIGAGCEYEDAERCAWLARVGEGYENPAPARRRKFYSVWPKKAEGKAVPIVFGATTAVPSLIWRGDFTPVPPAKKAEP